MGATVKAKGSKDIHAMIRRMARDTGKAARCEICGRVVKGAHLFCAACGNPRVIQADKRAVIPPPPASARDSATHSSARALKPPREESPMPSAAFADKGALHDARDDIKESRVRIHMSLLRDNTTEHTPEPDKEGNAYLSKPTEI